MTRHFDLAAAERQMRASHEELEAAALAQALDEEGRIGIQCQVWLREVSIFASLAAMRAENEGVPPTIMAECLGHTLAQALATFIENVADESEDAAQIAVLSFNEHLRARLAGDEIADCVDAILEISGQTVGHA